jgi:ferredoxin
VSACPRKIIDLANKSFSYSVSCRNSEKAAVMKLGCSVGCIACKRCVKACQEVFKDKPETGTAIEVENFLAKIDYNKCINCGKCAEVCPNKVIHSVTQAVIV